MATIEAIIPRKNIGDHAIVFLPQHLKGEANGDPSKLHYHKVMELMNLFEARVKKSSETEDRCTIAMSLYMSLHNLVGLYDIVHWNVVPGSYSRKSNITNNFTFEVEISSKTIWKFHADCLDGVMEVIAKTELCGCR